MNEVFQKTRELGDAILRSEEYARMKQTEAAAMKNASAAQAMGQYMEYRQQMQALMADDEKDWAKVKQVSEDMEACQQRMGMIDEVCAFTQAQEAFSDLIAQVNSVLRFIITGEMQEDGETGCTGSCENCGGCRSVH